MGKQPPKPEPKPVVTAPQGPKKVSVKSVITGGAGHVGFALGRALAKSGTSVILYDIRKPIWAVPQGVVFVQADVRHYNDLAAACEGVDCVFHAASFGMTGVEQLKNSEIRSVNVEGTRIVIEVCKQQNVPRLIYTSSINVVFAGQTVDDGDEESIPYCPLGKQVSEYSKTKEVAEQMVLAASGSSLKGGGTLHTCALRPPGIYGPDDQRHLPRLTLNAERRLFTFRLGPPTNRMNWVHVKNLVQAHILAADALTAEKSYIASGQAYFINDGEKVNLFDWLTPLFEKLGVGKPRIRGPVWGAYLTVCPFEREEAQFCNFDAQMTDWWKQAIPTNTLPEATASAILMETLYNILSPFVEITPLLTRNEVNYFAFTHTFKIDKARKQLGYAPKTYSFAECVDAFLKRRPRQWNFFLLKFFLGLLFLIGLMFLAIEHEEAYLFLLEEWAKHRHLLELIPLPLPLT